MPFKRAMPDQYGNANAAAHHVVVQMSLFPSSGEARIRLATYKDKPAKDGGNTPFSQDVFVVSGPEFDARFSDTELIKAGNSPLKAAESYLKTLPKFSGAVDE